MSLHTGALQTLDRATDMTLAAFLRSQTDIIDLHEEGNQWGSIGSGGFEALRRNHIIKLAQKFNLPLNPRLPKTDTSGKNQPCMVQYMNQWWHEGRFGTVSEPKNDHNSEARIAARDKTIEQLQNDLAEMREQISKLARGRSWPETMTKARELGIDITGKKRPEVEAELDARLKDD